MRLSPVIVLTFVVFLPLVASASVFELETFDSGWTMGTEWTKDRRLPNTVEAANFDGDSRLHFEINGDDKTDTWRDYEGIKHEVDMPEWGLQSFSIDLYVGDNWNKTDRNAGLWAQGLDANGETSAWPILVYRNMNNVDAGFYSYDYFNGGWDKSQDLGSTRAWYTLQFDLTVGTGIEYFVDGTSLGVFSDTDTADLSHVILNAYNFGDNQDVYFDNFTASAIPEPATTAIWSLLALAGIGLISWRRRQQS